ncbi:MAG: host attachment protein [Pseudomonadota bacterium]|nr:host attachment protein [Pseudomonadota bacterium]
MLLPHATLIAVIDGSEFELYRNTGTEAEPELTPEESPKLDGSNHSGGSHRSSSGNPGGHQNDEDGHAIAAAEWLNQQVLGHKVSDLVVFAAPRTLGEIRKHYHKLTEQALLGEINKSMAGRPPSELIAALHEPA